MGVRKVNYYVGDVGWERKLFFYDFICPTGSLVFVNCMIIA
jgi:hypothetical protein